MTREGVSGLDQLSAIRLRRRCDPPFAYDEPNMVQQARCSGHTERPSTEVRNHKNPVPLAIAAGWKSLPTSVAFVTIQLGALVPTGFRTANRLMLKGLVLLMYLANGLNRASDVPDPGLTPFPTRFP